MLRICKSKCFAFAKANASHLQRLEFKFGFVVERSCYKNIKAL